MNTTQARALKPNDIVRWSSSTEQGVVTNVTQSQVSIKWDNEDTAWHYDLPVNPAFGLANIEKVENTPDTETN